MHDGLHQPKRLRVMGRLPALIGVFGVLLAACPADDPAPDGGGARRSDMVVADGAPTPPVTTHDAAGTHASTPDAGPAAPRRTGPLCAERSTSIRAAATVPAPGGRVLQAADAAAPAAIDPSAAHWTWLNLWAAWCVPCREEMPLLRSWMTRLQQDGADVQLALLSLDDDERQLQQFLDRATGALPRASAWLPGGTTRTRWLKAVGLRDSPGLPVQLLIRPGGALACAIQGAVEPTDYDEIKRIVQGQVQN